MVYRQNNGRMERATWQSAVFKANLNHARENAARSAASNALVLRGVTLTAKKSRQLLAIIFENHQRRCGWMFKDLSDAIEGRLFPQRN